MKVHRIRLRNYRGVAEREVHFPDVGVTVVEGDNEVGKTSLAEALDLVLEVQDSSQAARVKAVQPVHQDVGPEVEIEVSTGPYRFVYAKRWLRQKSTTLAISEPRAEQLTGAEAHQRVVSILDETLDRHLFKALRLVQGAELVQPSLQGQALSTALDRTAAAAVGDTGAADVHDDLWLRIVQERDRYVTPTGQPRKERTDLAARLDTARAHVDALEARLARLDRDADEVARITDRLATMAEVRATHEATEHDLREAVAEVDRRRAEVRQLTAEHEAAALRFAAARGALDRREQLVADFTERTFVLEQRRHALEVLEPARTEAAARLSSVLEQLAEARRELREAERAHHRALRDRDHRRQEIELEQLTERRDRVAEARERLAAAEQVLDTVAVDGELLAEIEAAQIDLVRADAEARAGATSVHLDASVEVVVQVDGRTMALPAGYAGALPVSEHFELDVPGVVRAVVQPGVESRQQGAAVAEARERLGQLCERGGVADLVEARAAAARRAEAERDVIEAHGAIRRDLRDLDAETLSQKVERLAAKVQAYRAERPAAPPLPADLDAAQRLEQEASQRLADARQRVEELSADEATMRQTLAQVSVDDARVGTEVRQAELALAQVEQTLADARSAVDDTALAAELDTASALLADVERRLQAAQHALDQADPDGLEARLQNVTEALRRSRVEARQLEEQRAKLLGMLEGEGEHGLAHQLDEARTALAHLERDHRALEARAAAAVLLYERFEARRAEARQRYVSPFRERIEQLGRIVFGPSLSVGLDDDLRIVSRTLDGVTVAFEQLSTGAQEQLGIISRLACASIVAADGGVPVIVDDALGWTDPGRLERMGAALALAGRDCQVIVLTCTPGRYAGVGQAEVVRL
jgi:hypothetical protein